ncbi:hypothetical protein SEA_ODESZA_25 [Gordonia Phage Odesza]|uniref:Minor tail protein n=3 Tax=Tanisvirus tanis TaxID=2844677 RepID=A0A7D5FTM8_9CAUD|nr:minor tail protein [Gordonia phage Tanis]QGJ89636.1 hypothetical protein SEA_ODESZA_25 [Gordonia Phage Odesza]QKY78697.1 hypothetical protein SEA_GILL_25 [Gordonia phage Gill]QLF83741.1 hypothetical protein SEA_MAGEL_25 [Gordonia phage Magel]QYW00664.1 hypothetical protein SEA_RONEY_25 [Gordonia phage Roney]QFP95599.1 hypothetical protein SEA_TANIS_25 [Gordonia phage Tanis]
MARVTVTGFTAARMLQIEQSTVVNGFIQGDSLVLQTRGGDDIVTGNVRGPQGDKGDPGGVPDATNAIKGGVRLQGNLTGSAATPTITGALDGTVDTSLAIASTPNNSGWGGGPAGGVTMTLRQVVHQVQANLYAIQRTITKAGTAQTIWAGTLTDYNALASGTKNAAGFVAVIFE